MALDRPTNGGVGDGAVLHGGLAAIAFLIAAVVMPGLLVVEDVVVFSGIVAVMAAPFVLKRLDRAMRAAGYTGALQADRVTLASAIWVGASMATGSAKAVVFVLLVCALSAALKARPVEAGAAVEVQAKRRRVELHNTMSLLVEKLNLAQVALRDEHTQPVAALRSMSLRLAEKAPVTTRRRDPRQMPRSLTPNRPVPVRIKPSLARA